MKIGTARNKRTWRVKKLGDWVRFSDICKRLTIKSDCALRNSTEVSWTLISLVYKNSTQRNFTCTYSVIERYLFVVDVATPPSKTLRSAVRVREGQDHRDDGSCVVNSASNQPRRPFHHSWPADKSEVEYTSRRPSSGRFHQINSSKDRHIIRQARVELTSSLSTIQTQIPPSLQAPVSARTVARRLSERHLVSRRPLYVLPMTLTHCRLRLEWCRARRDWTAIEWNHAVFSDKSRLNLGSDDNRVSV